MRTNSWKIKRSILFELDALFSFVNGYLPRSSLSASINQLIDSIPSEMVQELISLLNIDKRFFNLLFWAGFAAKTEFEEDYSQATMPIRKLSSIEFIEHTISRAAESDIHIQLDPSLSSAEKIKNLQYQLVLLSSQRLGFIEKDIENKSFLLANDIEVLVRFLADGDLHDQFWHWLDRFFYQFYQPWRLSLNNLLDVEQEKAQISLGASHQHLQVDWLPQVNPLRVSTVFLEAIKKEELNVVFLVEPFQLPDAWFVFPEGLVTTFADNPEVINQFYDFLTHLSDRLKALADPNRLMIMRIARISSKDNTEIANFLNVSRPTVSIHAKQLRDTGLIKTFEEGRSVRHEVVADEVRQLFNDLQRFLDLPEED